MIEKLPDISGSFFLYTYVGKCVGRTGQKLEGFAYTSSKIPVFGTVNNVVCKY